MKLAVVGAGSTYTPELVAGLAGLEVERLALHDVDPGGSRSSAASPGGCSTASGFTGELSIGGELDAAVEGADFVLVQIRVGGQAARLHDETAPLPCGCIGQETTGAGGFAKAMRTVPVVLEIADRVRELAGPDAWIVDFTNPVGIVTRALLDAGHRAVGLCNVAITLQRRFAALLGVEPARVVVDQVGLNHLTWVRGVLLDGEDVLARRCSRSTGDEAGRRGAAAAPAARGARRGAVVLPALLLRARRGARRAARRCAARGDRRRDRGGLLELYRDPSLNEKPALLEQRGGAFYSEAAAGLVRSLAYDIGDVHEVDVRNDGTLAGLADDDVVEVPARVESGPDRAARAARRSRRSCSGSSSTSPRTSA